MEKKESIGSTKKVSSRKEVKLNKSHKSIVVSPFKTSDKKYDVGQEFKTSNEKLHNQLIKNFKIKKI